MKQLKKLEIPSEHHFSQKGTQHLRGLEHLVELNMSGLALCDKAMAHLSELRRLHTLVVFNMNSVTTAGWRSFLLPSMNGLNTLSLIFSLPSDESLECIASSNIASTLTTLKYSVADHTGKGSTNVGLGYVSQLQQLTNLELFDCRTNVGTDGFLQLAKLKNLQSLRLDGVHSSDETVSDGVAKVIKGNQQLETLILHECPISEECLKAICETRRLKTLCITGSSDVTDDSVEMMVEGLATLTELNLSNCCNVSDNALQHLTHLPHLKSLEVGCDSGDLPSGHTVLGFSDAGVTSIANGLPTLASLRICGHGCDELTDDAVAAIAENLTQLRTLELVELDEISNDAFENMSNLKHLTHLNCFCCPSVSDDSFAHVAAIPNLIVFEAVECGMDEVEDLEEQAKGLFHFFV